MEPFRILISLIGIIIFSFGCTGSPSQKTPDITDNTPPDIHFKITNVLPHDSISYTEGLFFHGSSNICYRDPSDFRIIKTLSVHDNNGPVQNLNELELIHGFLYSNQWLTNYILKIDTSSGRVVGRMDLSALKKEAKIKYPFAEETNGIAFDSATNRIYVTGKKWPVIYEIAE